MFTNRLSIRLVSVAAAVSGVLLGVFGVSMADEPNAAPPSRDPTCVVTPFSIQAGDDLTQSVHVLVRKAQIPINVIVLVDSDQAARFVVPGYSLPPGSYDVGSILNSIRSADPDMTWRADGGRITVTFSHDSNVSNPLLNTVDEPITESLTGPEWVRYLVNANRAISLQYAQSSGLLNGPPRRMDQPITLKMPKGTRALAVVNALAEATNSCYRLEIRDKPEVIGYPRLPDGRRDMAHPVVDRRIARAEITFYELGNGFFF